MFFKFGLEVVVDMGLWVILDHNPTTIENYMMKSIPVSH